MCTSWRKWIVCVHTSWKQLTAIEPVKSSSLYFEFVLTSIYIDQESKITMKGIYIIYWSGNKDIEEEYIYILHIYTDQLSRIYRSGIKDNEEGYIYCRNLGKRGRVYMHFTYIYIVIRYQGYWERIYIYWSGIKDNEEGYMYILIRNQG